MSTSTVAAEFLPAEPNDLATARAALEVERANVAALSLFARRMAHDMSNFVTVVRTYSELLLADLPAGGSRDDVREIHSAADAMIEYMQRVVRFARAGSSRVATVVLDDVVGEVIRETALAHRLSSHLASNASVRIDAAWLTDATRELLVNAREASLPGHETAVRTWRELLPHAIVDAGVPIEAGTWAVLEIVDSGPGFSAEAGRQSLNPFVTTKVGVRGAGFGLALARSAAWQAGGHLVINAGSAVRPGGRVRVWFPAEFSDVV